MSKLNRVPSQQRDHEDVVESKLGVVVGAPVFSEQARNTPESMRAEVDRLVCLAKPQPFFAIDQRYRRYDQLNDQQVVTALEALGRKPVTFPAQARQLKELKMMKWLIAVDGSDHARKAVETAARMSKQFGGFEVLLLNVGVKAAYYGDLPNYDHEGLERAQREHQKALLEQALAHAHSCGLKEATTQATIGPVAQEIVRVAEEQGADQIVMGTHGHGAVGSLFVGSVAQRVLHLSKLPVLMVK